MSTASLPASPSPTRTSQTRPLDDDLTSRLLAEARRALQHDGPERLRVDDIVTSCRTSKSAVYRRWGDREAFIAAAIESFVWDDVEPRGSDPRADLIAVIESWVYRDAATDAQASQLIRSITAHGPSRRSYERFVWPRRRSALAQALRHHVLHVAGDDADAVLRLPQAFVIDVVVAQERSITRADIAGFVDAVFLPLLTAVSAVARPGPHDLR